MLFLFGGVVIYLVYLFDIVVIKSRATNVLWVIWDAEFDGDIHI